MAQVIIRNLKDDVVARLKQKAARNGHSLEQELREVLEAAAQEAEAGTVAARRALLDAVAEALTCPVAQTPSWILIREDRDNDDPYR